MHADVRCARELDAVISETPVRCGFFSFVYCSTHSVLLKHSCIDPTRLPCECINRLKVVAAARKPFVMRQKHKQQREKAKRKYIQKYLNGNILLSLSYASHASKDSVVFFLLSAYGICSKEF